MLGTQPYLCANLGTGTWDEAQQWVEYCNSAEGTAMTNLREKNGRQKPWKVIIGVSATKWTAPGRWAIARPTITASSRSKPPR